MNQDSITVGKGGCSSLLTFRFYDGCTIHLTTKDGNVEGWAYRIIGQVDLRCPHGCTEIHFLNEGDLPLANLAKAT